MSQQSTHPARIRFRSVRERTFEDQSAAMAGGYNSVLELAFDEMLQSMVELEQRVERLEQGNGDALTSRAQARKFRTDPKLRRYYAEYAAATDFSKLPERVRPRGKKRHHFKHGVLHELSRRSG